MVLLRMCVSRSSGRYPIIYTVSRAADIATSTIHATSRVADIAAHNFASRALNIATSTPLVTCFRLFLLPLRKNVLKNVKPPYCVCRPQRNMIIRYFF